MYSTSLSDIYHDIPAFTVNGMVRNVKNGIFKESNTTFL